MEIDEKIVITGSPGTGKTAIIKALHKRGYACLSEVSREITLEARAQGIEQLFLEDPLVFSQKLLERRTQQFYDAEKLLKKPVFIDRGVPDVLAYMDYVGDTYPDHFVKACEKCIYDKAFLLPPWEEIYTSDSERYENFQQAVDIHFHIKKTYARYGYHLIEVPVGKVETRTDFIINALR